MWSILKSLLKDDIKFIARQPLLLLALLAPFILILSLKLVFPLLSGFIFSKTGFAFDSYYSLVAITFVSIIPVLIGFAGAFLIMDEFDEKILHATAVTPASRIISLYMRILISVFICFFMVLFSILMIDPVPAEGWLRTIFVSILLATQSPFIFLFIGSFAGNKTGAIALSKLYGVFLVAVPLGLLLHHPWNYFAFFSPLYWISWTWITSVIIDSFIYSAIAMIITFGGILFFFRHYLKKHIN